MTRYVYVVSMRACDSCNMKMCGTQVQNLVYIAQGGGHQDCGEVTAESHIVRADMELVLGEEKLCTSCDRTVQRRGFSERQWRRYNWRRCKDCTASTANTADVELQAMLHDAEASAVADALEEVALTAEDRVQFMSVWDEQMAAHKTENLVVVMNKIVVALMQTLGAAASKEKKDQYRRVWSKANQTLWQLLHPDQKNPKAASQHIPDDDLVLDHPWPSDALPGEALCGYWVTTRVGNRTGGRDEILAALQPASVSHDIECKSLTGLGKSLVFISVSSPSNLKPTTCPNLNQILAELYAQEMKCRFCETITPLQWVGKADDPTRVAAECRPLVEALLGPHLDAVTFGIEYKCHHHQGGDGSKHAKESRKQWIQLFGESVPRPHTVDLSAPQVVIHLRLFVMGADSYIGVSVEREKERLKCPRDTAQYVHTPTPPHCNAPLTPQPHCRYHSLGSHGEPYYRAGINLNAPCQPCHGEEPLPSVQEALDVWELEKRYADRLQAGVAEVTTIGTP